MADGVGFPEQLTEEELRAIVAAIPDVLLVVNAEGRYLRIIPTNTSQLYRPPEQLIGRTILEVFPQPQGEEFMGYVRRAIEEHRTVFTEYVLPIGGRSLLFTAAIAPLGSGNALLVARDITYRLEAEKHKGELLAVASHELRRPLSTLLLSIQAARRRAAHGKPPDTKTLEHMEAHCARTAALVDDLLDLARIEKGAFSLRLAEADLCELTSHAVADAGVRWPGRVTFSCPAAEVMVLVDPDRIDQVLANLIDNACKYSPATEPVVVAMELSEDEVRTSVTDRGQGIPAELQEKVFERYYRIYAEPGRAPGLGLGLFISREIVKRHGGRIWLESEPGRGSTFTFALPRHR